MIPTSGMPARFGLLGDVHADSNNLELAIDHLLHEGVDRLLCVGDIVDGPGDVARCVDLLLHADVATVRGNHDRWLLADAMRSLPDAHSRETLPADVIAYLEQLPVTLEFSTSAGGLLLSHGVGADDMFFLRPDIGDYDIRMSEQIAEISSAGVTWAISGHTHEPMDRTIRGVRFVNPGPTAQMPTGSCALLDVSTGTVQRWSIADLSV